MTYQDFDLLVQRSDTVLRATVLRSPAGTASVEFSLPFSEDRIENCLLRLGRTRRATRRVESSEMQTAKEFGSALFDAVLSGPVAECFHRSLETARQEGAGLRIRLRVAAGDLADLPWEFLYDAEVNRFLALSVRTPLVRYIDLPDAVQPLMVTSPIRALVMISSPRDFPRLDVESEWRRLNESLADLVEAGVVAIDRLDNATLSALQRHLRKAHYHIFHFIGHGEFDRASQEGVLILEGESHTGERVGSQYLGALLHDHESLRLAILNACEGARTSRMDPFAGTAQTLVQQGIPAVIAMQFEIADEVASTFAHEFYGAVADGYPIDAAVTEARKAIFASGRDVEWGTPVLYLRAPDGRIFDVARQSRANHAARDPMLTSIPSPAVTATAAGTKERAAALARDAGVALAYGRFEDALRHLAEARALDPGLATLGELTQTAEQQRAVARTRAQRRRGFQAHLAAARELCARQDFAGASRRLNQALELRPGDADALAVKEMIREAQDRVRAGRSSPLPVPSEGNYTGAGNRDTVLGRADEPDAVRPAARAPLLDDERDLLD